VFDSTELITLSRIAGERFDLVQAGGGNSSVKREDGTIYVKASGLQLGDVQKETDFCCLDWRPLLKFVQDWQGELNSRQLESVANEVTNSAIQGQGIRPSIEVLMHCIFGPFTLHTHPIVANIVSCRQNWKDVLKAWFPSAICVDYVTPGAPLAIAISKEIAKSGWEPGFPAIVFLGNHGLIVSAGSVQEVMSLTDEVVLTIEKELSLDFSRYRLTNFISAAVDAATGKRPIVFISEDGVLRETLANNENAFGTGPVVPDQLVYCGPKCLHLKTSNIEEASKAIKQFMEEFGMPPYVVIAESGSKKHLFTVGKSIRKCREVEDVLKSHVQILNNQSSSYPLQFLKAEELAYLSNWDAEKYRKNL